MRKRSTGLTLLRLSGWKARVMNVVVGTPLFGFGGLLVLGAVFDTTGLGRVILFGVGVLPALVGTVLYLRALRGTDFVLKLSRSNSSTVDAD